MNELTSILRDKAAGISVVALGKAWHLSLVEWGIQDAFCEWLVLQAKMRLVRMRDDLDAESAVINARNQNLRKGRVDLYREEMDALSRRIDGYEFDWAGPVMKEAIEKERPWCYLLYLLLRERHPDVTPEQASDIFADGPEMVRDAVLEALQAGDPKHFPRPAKAEPAGGGDAARTTGTASAD